MQLTETTVQKNYVYRGKIISVRSDDALLPDGSPCKRELIEHSGGAAVLYVEDGKLLLVKQFRYAYGEVIYEIPAGKLEKGEDPKQAALRELEEEAGVCATEAELLFVLYPTPGYTNEKIYIYKAENGVKKTAHPDDGEFIAAEWIALSEAERMLKNGVLRDAKTIVALQAYLLNK
ncbi:MAG: NUDIX hydrolase [Clostridia bacterium]|nr:NUDIX hydrolase [Clostridia bacterium]